MKITTVLVISTIMILFAGCKEAQQTENEEIAERIAVLERDVAELQDCSLMAAQCSNMHTQMFEQLSKDQQEYQQGQNKMIDKIFKVIVMNSDSINKIIKDY